MKTLRGLVLVLVVLLTGCSVSSNQGLKENPSAIIPQIFYSSLENPQQGHLTGADVVARLNKSGLNAKITETNDQAELWFGKTEQRDIIEVNGQKLTVAVFPTVEDAQKAFERTRSIPPRNDYLKPTQFILWGNVVLLFNVGDSDGNQIRQAFES
jgi:hypothetical protein